MSKFKLLFVFMQTVLLQQLIAQDKCPIKFGKVTIEDFNTSSLKVDTSDGAVIIADIGTSSFEGNDKGWFSLVYKHQKRIKIINKNGFDLANIEIPLYISIKTNDEEKIDKLKATSYNIVNGEIVETKLKDDAVFKDKLDDNHIIKKFTMPSVKEGTIIEYSYTIISDFLFNLQDWSFQGKYPCIWSEYQVDLPEFFDYVMISQGYHAFDIKTNKSSLGNFNVRSRSNQVFGKDDLYNITGSINTSRWVMKNMPSLKQEKFTSTLGNHISKIDFQLSGYNFPNVPYESVMSNWPKVCEKLLAASDFGEGLTKNNGWLKETNAIVNLNASNDLTRTKNSFNYVKSNFKSLGIRNIYLTKSLKEVLSSKSGYANEINLFLTALLKYQNINASPVILSTVSHGYTNALYPIINRYNYVITKVTIDDNDYFLDASQPYFGFNKLPAYCYNGHARTVNSTFPTPIYFNADSITETKNISIMLFNDEKKVGKWVGNINFDYGNFESNNIRKQLHDKGKSNFENLITKEYTNEFNMSKFEYKDLDSCEKALNIACEFVIENNDQSKIIYLNPLMKFGYSENPFKSLERKYPVEMPYKIDDNFSLNIEIPKDYLIDELPKSAKVLFNENEGVFEYYVTKNETEINIISHIKFEKAFFMPEDYETLRSFYDYIVKKHAENIVFKKKN